MSNSTSIGASPELSNILERIDRFVAVYPQARQGPAHVVLSDYNFDNRCIAYCLRCIHHHEFDMRGHTDQEIEATRLFLQGLRDIPEAEREAAEHELVAP